MIQLAAGHIAQITSNSIFGGHKSYTTILTNENLIDEKNGRIKIHPVPLTQSILEINGFKQSTQSKSNFAFRENSISAVAISRKQGLWYIVITGIKDDRLPNEFQSIRLLVSYVHELQVILQAANSQKQLHL